MPNVKIETPQAEGATASYGTRVFVDGREVTDLQAVDFHAAVDDVVTVTLRALVTESLRFEGGADLHVNVVALPGFVVVEEMRPDGTKTYRAEPIK